MTHYREIANAKFAERHTANMARVAKERAADIGPGALIEIARAAAIGIGALLLVAILALFVIALPHIAAKATIEYEEILR